MTINEKVINFSNKVFASLVLDIVEIFLNCVDKLELLFKHIAIFRLISGLLNTFPLTGHANSLEQFLTFLMIFTVDLNTRLMILKALSFNVGRSGLTHIVVILMLCFITCTRCHTNVIGIFAITS